MHHIPSHTRPSLIILVRICFAGAHHRLNGYECAFVRSGEMAWYRAPTILMSPLLRSSWRTSLNWEREHSTMRSISVNLRALPPSHMIHQIRVSKLRLQIDLRKFAPLFRVISFLNIARARVLDSFRCVSVISLDEEYIRSTSFIYSLTESTLNSDVSLNI